MGAPFGIRAWRQVMKWDGATGTHRKMFVPVRKKARPSDI
jgi:hypothetical protein